METLNVLDLFAGSGELGRALAEALFESLGVRTQTVAYCERADYPRAVLLSRMLRSEIDVAPIHDDITGLVDPGAPIDAIVGGWPCQGNSLAGRRKGMDDERSGLVVEVVRLVRDLGPSLVFLENVPGVLTAPGDGVGYVLTELARLGYECRWTDLSAGDVGQAHERRRFWLMAFRIGGERSGQSDDANGDQRDGAQAGRKQSPSEFESGSAVLGDLSNQRHQRSRGARGRRPGPADTGKELGHDNGQRRGEERRGAPRPSGHGGQPGEAVGDSAGKRLQVGRDAGPSDGCAEWTSLPVVPPARDDHRGWEQVINLQLDVEPTIRRVVARVAYRADRIRVIGNGVDFVAAKAAAKALIAEGMNHGRQTPAPRNGCASGD